MGSVKLKDPGAAVVYAWRVARPRGGRDERDDRGAQEGASSQDNPRRGRERPDGLTPFIRDDVPPAAHHRGLRPVLAAAGELATHHAPLALALDAVDGWVARRTRTTESLGARFDAEVDAFLILVLSVYVARSAGAWVLAIGAARYAFLAAGWPLPWMRAPLPPRYWSKVVAATQGIVLTIAAADVLPLALSRAVLLAALVLLGESFGRHVWWLWSHRHAAHSRVPASADSTLDLAVATPVGARRGRVRTTITAVLTILALLVVWAALARAQHPPMVARRGHGARRRLAALFGVRRAACVPHPHRLHECRRPRRPRGACGAGRPPRPGRLRQRDQARPLPLHPCQPAADRPAWQGRPPRVR